MKPSFFDSRKPSPLFEKTFNRRDALKALAGSLAVGVLGCKTYDVNYSGTTPPNLDAVSVSRESFPDKDKLPNIIFILSDDHRWDAMSCMNHPFISTPNLDKLAEQGVHFENTFVTTSLCSPSRASFLTGQYAHTHGVKNNLTQWNNDNITFLEILKAAGYDTAFIGKWHMPGEIPPLRGIDRFITFTVQAGQGRYFDCPLIIDGVETPRPGTYITEDLTDYALDFMEKERDNPFCLYLSHKAIHHQFLPPPELDGLYDEVELELPYEYNTWIGMTNGLTYSGVIGPMEPHYRNYCEAIVALDQQIGRVMQKIEEMGIAENTIVVYAGDNGYFWGEHKLVDKRWPYEEAIRIPMIIKDPRTIQNQGRRSQELALNIDMAPTILDLAGIPIPDNMEGKSVKPILQNRDFNLRDSFLYEYYKEFPYNTPELNAVRTRNYIYIDYEGGRPHELYDIIEDPRTQINLMGTEQGEAVLPELKELLSKYIAQK